MRLWSVSRCHLANDDWSIQDSIWATWRRYCHSDARCAWLINIRMCLPLDQTIRIWLPQLTAWPFCFDRLLLYNLVPWNLKSSLHRIQGEISTQPSNTTESSKDQPFWSPLTSPVHPCLRNVISQVLSRPLAKIQAWRVWLQGYCLSNIKGKIYETFLSCISFQRFVVISFASKQGINLSTPHPSHKIVLTIVMPYLQVMTEPESE